MSAQHKRPGRRAKLERQRRARERARAVIICFPRRWEQRDPYRPGRLVIAAELEEVIEA